MVDLTRQRFGRLLAIRPTKRRSGNSIVWKCRCDCKKITYVGSSNLRRGTIQSCGCLTRETPTWPEAIFYGLVLGTLNGQSKDFQAQERLSVPSCNHTVDARLGRFIFELDGGGHHAFGDRAEHDELIDKEYAEIGYMVIRAPNESELFVRLLQVLQLTNIISIP